MDLETLAQSEAQRIKTNIDFLKDRNYTYIELKSSVKDQLEAMKQRLDQWFQYHYPEASPEQIMDHLQSWDSQVYNNRQT